MIINKSNGTKLALKCRILSSQLEKGIGLMFHKPIKDEGFVFLFDSFQKVYFHTFFVFFPIDMLFLDKKKRVVDIVRNVKPFTLNISSEAKYVIELAAGSAKNTKIGDIINFK